MAVKGATTTAQLAVMAAAAADQLLDMVQVPEQVAKAIPEHQAVIIGQAMAAVAHLSQVLGCKAEGALLAQSQVLAYLEQVEVEVEEIVQSIVATELMAAAEVTAVLQTGATATTHTVKILAEDGELLMPILLILDLAAALAHTGPQTSDGIKAADMVLAA
jgi:hypothetical protein